MKRNTIKKSNGISVSIKGENGLIRYHLSETMLAKMLAGTLDIKVYKEGQTVVEIAKLP